MERKQKSSFHHLRSKWSKRHKHLQKRLATKHAQSLEWLQQSSKNLMMGGATGLLMLTNPTTIPIVANVVAPLPVVEAPQKNISQLVAELTPLLPQEVVPLTEDQEKSIGQLLTGYFKIPVTAELDNKRLNRSYGLIGAEQHLMRYPGDTMITHLEKPGHIQFAKSGMAPGRGAWGYFTDLKDRLTQKDIDREKYYIAVQTFLSPGWKERSKELSEFFKYRKMLVVNPETGKAVIAIIGDAGPSVSTGKHLGGSPEVMWYLERQDGRARGPVLYFFIDDPQDTVPLGPITVK